MGGGVNLITPNGISSIFSIVKYLHLKFIIMIFVVSSVLVSCSKESEFIKPEQPRYESLFTPQCNQGVNLDTTIHVKIALMTLNIANDEYFNLKIALLLQESNPTEQKYYDILGFQGLELTSSEVDYLQSLENDATAKEAFYKDVERQFNCLVSGTAQVRVGLWETLWAVGSSAAAVGIMCGTVAGCVGGVIYAANTMGGLYCKYHPNNC